MSSGGENRRPRIVLAHPSPDLYGSDRMLVESVRGLADEYDVVVTVPADGPLCPVLRECGAEVVVRSAPVLRKAFLSPLGLLRLAALSLRSLPGMLRLLRSARPALLYVNTITLPLWIVAGRLAGVPVLCHVHEAEDRGPGLVRAALAMPLRLAGMLVLNSRASAEALGPVAASSRGRARIIYNGVDAPLEISPLRPALSPPVQVVLVGRISPRKGSDVAVKAIRLLRDRGHDARLTLVGDVFPGYEWFRDEVSALAGTDGVVEFTGFQESVWGALAAADIAVVPSLAEPFGNVAVEAMLAGRPVVASATQGLTEVLSDGETGVLVAPGDPVALADGLRRVLDDWPEATARAERARKDAAQRFGKERYHRDLAAAVRDLLT